MPSLPWVLGPLFQLYNCLYIMIKAHSMAPMTWRIAQDKGFLRLVGESKIKTKGWEDESLECLLRSQLVSVLGNSSHIRVIQLDQVAVVFNTRGCD